MRQEIDAMRTLGLDPDMVLFLPRILALVMVLPILGLISAVAGMQVGKDAESLGRMTSSAVVSAIFAVIIADAACSIFFARVGL